MIEFILINEKPLKAMKLLHENLTVPEKMNELNELFDLLQPLKELTYLFYPSNYVSISFLYPAIFT